MISDQEFSESVANRERMYRVELGRQPYAADHPDATAVDTLGRGRWPVEYLTARQRGYSHKDAMQVERVSIRKAAGLPATEPMPTPPAPPPPPPLPPPPSPVDPPPVVDVPGVKDNLERFVTFYGQRCGRLNWQPDETTSREDRVQFLQATIKEYRIAKRDKSFVMKRADERRPISDEAVVFTIAGADYRRFWDFIISGGSVAWKLSVHGDGEILPAGQILVDPETLDNLPG